MRHLLDSLRGARRIGLFAALAVVALSGLMLLGHGGQETTAVGKTALEQRLESVLSRIDGVGAVHAMIAQDDDGTVIGAVIVCEALDGVSAYLDVQAAIQALLGLETSRIKVIGRHGFGGYDS